MRQMWFGLAALLLVTGLAVSAHGAGAQTSPTPIPLPDPELGSVDLDAAAAIDLAALPLVPDIGERALALYRAGLTRGHDPFTFAKVGDCMTDNPYFLIPIGAGEYALGEYDDDLAPVIAHYSQGEPDPFGRKSQASAGGFNAASILDSLWANPQHCEPGETPLACEFRTMRPSVALIMFGTNDVYYLDEAQFDYFLRSIVVETVRQDVLPVLSTFPHRPEYPEKSLLYNQLVAQIAHDYDVPLINLWLALDDLPNKGVDPEDTTHLTTPAGGAACYFIGDNLEAGFTVRNLLALQTLGALLDAAAADEE